MWLRLFAALLMGTGLVSFDNAVADTLSGSYTLYNSNGSPLQMASTGSSAGGTVDLSGLTSSLQGFRGFSSLQVNIALYGNGGTTQTSDSYSGYSLSHDVYSSDGSVEYVYLSQNENIVNAYTTSAASVTVGNSSNSGQAPYTTSTAQTLSNAVTGSRSCAGGACYLYNGFVYFSYQTGSANLCNIGDCYLVFTKNQYVTTAGYTGEYGISVPLSLYDVAGVNATNSLPYEVVSAAGPNELLSATLDYSYSPVPVPAAAWLMLSGLGGLGLFRRKLSAWFA